MDLVRRKGKLNYKPDKTISALITGWLFYPSHF